jgi:hypothetical protein
VAAHDETKVAWATTEHRDMLGLPMKHRGVHVDRTFTAAHLPAHDPAPVRRDHEGPNDGILRMRWDTLQLVVPITIRGD